MSDQFITEIVIFLVFCVICFFVGLYIFRSVFNIPSFLRYQRAQVRLLEEIAKAQGVESVKVQKITAEVVMWESKDREIAFNFLQE